MSETKHTPGPWQARCNVDGAPPHVVVVYKDDQGRRVTAFVATCSSMTLDNAANAEFIVRACNSHDDLLDVAKRKLADCRDSLGCASGELMPGEYCSDECAALAAAIAKAEGRS